MMSHIDSTFAADNVEDFKLFGCYDIKTFFNNEENLSSLEQLPEYHCKAVFYKGNVLYKADEPKILDYINLMIKLTYTKTERSIEKNIEQLKSGTICPTREDNYETDDKIFTLYGRYIYGFVDFDKVTFSNKITGENFFLHRVEGVSEEAVHPFLYENNFAFKIVDKKTKVLYAFGLYR